MKHILYDRCKIKPTLHLHLSKFSTDDKIRGWNIGRLMIMMPIYIYSFSMTLEAIICALPATSNTDNSSWKIANLKLLLISTDLLACFAF